LLRKELVDAKTKLFATEARQFGEQWGGVDLQDQPACATADDLDVRSMDRRQDLIEGFVVAAAILASSCLTQDVA